MAKIYDVKTSEENPVITFESLKKYHQGLVESGGISSAEARYIIIECSEDYNGHTFTATNKDGEPSFSAEASENEAIIVVTKTGRYTISNDLNEETLEVFVGDVINVEFFSFKATVTVTIPESLVGSTITCSQDSKVYKQKSSSTTVEFSVNKEGIWNIGVEGNSYIKGSVTVSEDKGSYSTTLSVSTGVPRISVTTSKKVEGKVLKCTKSETVLSQTVKNQATEFIVPELGEWTLSCEDFPDRTTQVNVEEAKTYNARYSVGGIYGVRVKQSESDPERRVEYVEDAAEMQPVKVNTADGTVNYNGWDETWIFEKIYPVMLKTNGTEDYKLNPNDYSQKLEGGSSDVANTSYDGNAMVHIDCYYSKYYEDGGYEYYLISDEKEDGFEPLGFKRADGSVMECGYLPMFKGWIDGSGKLRSISGKPIRCSTSYIDFRTAALKNGNNYCLEPHGFINNYDILYLILSKNDDCQTAFGQGRDYNYTGGTGSGSGTEMKITTGFANNKGPIAYDTASKGIKFMHVEDHWTNNAYWWMDGYMYKDGVYIKWGGPYDSQSTSGYTKIVGCAQQATSSSGYISKSMASMQYGRIPTELNGSTSTYQCDQWNNPGTNNSTIYACRRANNGLWYRSLNSPTYTNSLIGSALSYEPPSAR